MGDVAHLLTGQGQSIPVGSRASLLSSEGLKACGGRLPFVLKGPLMQSVDRGQAAGKEATWPWHLLQGRLCPPWGPR